MCFSSANIDTLDNKNQLLVDIFLEYIQHNLPEGVSVIVQKVMQQFTKELLQYLQEWLEMLQKLLATGGF